MPREQAEDIFLFSFCARNAFSKTPYFLITSKGGWMEFILQFDEQSRLRRLYIRHKDLSNIKHEIGISSQVKLLLPL